MSRKQFKSRTGAMVQKTIVGFILCAFAFLIVGPISRAVADPTDTIFQAGAFGFDAATQRSTSQGEPKDIPDTEHSPNGKSLKGAYQRDITSGLAMVDRLEAEERERILEECYAANERVAANKEKQGAQSALNENGTLKYKDAKEYGLAAVDWSWSRDDFVDYWANRINAYLVDSPMENLGRIYAEAAWDSGVDPRWSPAISNTESTKGEDCFMAYNAWGWGDASWTNWESAIRDQVAGLAEGYGYSITLQSARIYCPPNSAHWYEATLEQMALI